MESAFLRYAQMPRPVKSKICSEAVCDVSMVEADKRLQLLDLPCEVSVPWTLFEPSMLTLFTRC